MDEVTLRGLFQRREQQYLEASAVALFIYDYFTTLGDEVTFVWRRPKGMGTVLYLSTRYPAFIDLSLSFYHVITPGLTHQQCMIFDKAMGYSFMVGICMAEVIMAIRVWSLWGRTRLITIVLLVLVVACVVVGATAIGQPLASAPAQDIAPHLTRCYRSGSNGPIFIAFTGLMGFEAVVLTLTLVKCLRHSRLRGSQLINPSSLFDLFIRDGVIYFVGLFAASTINIIMLHGDSQADMTAFQRSMHSVLACRVFIHIRRTASTTFVPNVGESLPYEVRSGDAAMASLAFVHDSAASGSSSV